MVQTRRSGDIILPPAPKSAANEANTLKRKAAGDDGASMAREHREMSKADRELYLLLDSFEFVLDCMHSVKATPAEYLVVKELFIPLTEMVERKWSELAVHVVALRPGLGKLSAVSGLVSDFIAKKQEADGNISEVLRRTLGSLPVSFLKKIHLYLGTVTIDMGNSRGACMLLRNYHGKSNSVDKSILRWTRGYDLDLDRWWRYFVAARHALNQPLASTAFKSLSSTVALKCMKVHGHPSSWYANRTSLVHMQAEDESVGQPFKAHDALLVLFNHFELDDALLDNLSPHIDRERGKYLLDPVVLTCIRSHYVAKETAQRKPKFRLQEEGV